MYSLQEDYVWKLDFHEELSSRDEVLTLRSSLLRVIKLDRDFSSCLSLLQFCDRKMNTRLKPNDFQSWKNTSIRDGAIILEQYLQAIKFTVTGEGWQQKIDRKSLSRARKQFDARFPNISDIRQTIVHQSELSRQGMEKHSINTLQNFGALTIDGRIMETFMPSNYIWNGYYASYRGKLVGYLLNAASAEALSEITAMVLQAFVSIDHRQKPTSA